MDKALYLRRTELQISELIKEQWGEERAKKKFSQINSFFLTQLAAVGGFWTAVVPLSVAQSGHIIKWNVVNNVAEAGARTTALREPWDGARKSEAQGVDVRMFLESANEPRKPTLGFKHDGTVIASDACYSVKSSYIILQEGSLVVCDLSKPKEITGSSCGGVSASSTLRSSELDPKDGGWTAHDGKGQKLVDGLKEHAAPAPTSDS